MTIRGTYTITAGTYTNFRKTFVNMNVIIQGTVIFNGDTAIVCDTGSINTISADITLNYSSGARKLVLATLKGTITLGPITATDCEVILHEQNPRTTTSDNVGSIRTYASYAITSPTISAGSVHIYGQAWRRSNKTDTTYRPVSIGPSNTTLTTFNYSFATNSGLVVRDNGADNVSYYDLMDSGKTYNLAYVTPAGLYGTRNFTATSTYYLTVPTTETIVGSVSLMNIRTEFGGTLDNMSLTKYYAGAGLVPSGTVGYPGGVSTPIPSSGTISVNNFMGSTKV